MDTRAIRLTETVKKGGCAAKLPAGELRKVLSGLDLPRLPQLTVGAETMDDACLWDLGDGRYLIQTLDFFTPILDDAESFGAVAAANALSDVYAMGGEPSIALSILAFPSATLPIEILMPLMQGALQKIREAGACLGGGHTIDDETLKLGFSVTGFVEKGQEWTNAGARSGDVLILTKALGTGTITSALKTGKASPESLEAAIASMTQLNRVRDLIADTSVHAATDVTGFGLAGHLLQMCRASGVRAEINLQALPVLPGALELLSAGVLNKAHHSNARYTSEEVTFESSDEALRWLTVDPQTSGGLLLAVPKAEAPELVTRLRTRFPQTQVIGQLKDGTPGLEMKD